MSWVKSVSCSGEDVFDEDADDISLQNKEWKYNMEKRAKDGFVDGIDAGKEASLQIGFNQGYREGATRTVAVGRLKGIVSAIQCWCQIQGPGTPVPSSVTNLLRRVEQHEDSIMNAIGKALESPPPSVSDVSDGMEDLGVDKASCREGGSNESECCSGSKPGDCCCEQPQKPCSSSSDPYSISEESLDSLLQCCMDVVIELGLPEELIQHLLQLKNPE